MKTLSKILLLTTFCILYSLFCLHSQNLVPNPSFEDTVACPNDISQINKATDWNNCGGTPDYLNTCALSSSGVSIPENYFGFQQSTTTEDQAYVGFYGKCFWSNCREYIGVELISQMTIGQKYYFSMQINLTNNSNCGINNLGVIFSTVAHFDSTGVSPDIYNFAHIYSPYITTDTVNWTTIKGSIIADSTYKYITIGNFFDDTMTDSIMLNGDILCQSYYFVDNICVSTDSSTCYLSNNIYKEFFKTNLTLFPNPLEDNFCIKNASTNEIKSINIYDVIGRNQLFSITENKDEIIIDAHFMKTGTYFLIIKLDNVVFREKIIKL
ncbi:MAG: T9SS type A sorting domain-containing protein [Bacteroidota bacterium]